MDKESNMNNLITVIISDQSESVTFSSESMPPELTESLKTTHSEVPEIELPDCIILRKGPPDNVMYYKLTCDQCGSLFSIINHKVHIDNTHTWIHFHCHICNKIQKNKYVGCVSFLKEYVLYPYLIFNSCTLL